jgi:sugar lactone lactonase YvrE
MNEQPVCIYEARNICGEGPVWDGQEQALYWTDIVAKKIFRRREADGRVTEWPVPTNVGAFALRKKGGAVIALRTGFAFFDFEGGTLQGVAHLTFGRPDVRFNDGKCDSRGRFWCGTCHEVTDLKDKLPIGSLYRLDPDLTLHQIVQGIKTSNGIDWSPDGRTMYYADTPTLRIDAFDFDAQSGSLSNRRVFKEVVPRCGRPDGLAIDAEGCIWSAHWDGWRITRYRPDGTIDRVVRFPVQNVTSCVFGGADLQTLYVTTATEELSSEELAQQPLAGGLFMLRPGVPGMPMHRFAG